MSARASTEPNPPSGYLDHSRRPLHILLFLLPLVVVYEIALAVLLRHDGAVVSNLAHVRLLEVMSGLGVPATSGLYLGGFVIVAVLLAWHLLARDPWRVRPGVLGGMTVEALVLTVPLLVLARILPQMLIAPETAGAAPLLLAAVPPAPEAAAVPDQFTRLAISIGAGLYEELVFRMLLIAMIHTLVVDLLRLPGGLGTTAGVLVSTLLFVLYHPISQCTTADLAFLTLGGLYFGVIYVVRGFGIVVAVHAIYDALTFATATPSLS